MNNSQLKIHDIETAVVNQIFDFKSNLVVPNVYWGWHLNYEADLIIVSGSGIVSEIEIKTSLQDLKSDFQKRFFHDGKYVAKLWYAGPKELESHFLELCPEDAGIIIVEKVENSRGRLVRQARIVRKAKLRKGYKKLTLLMYSKLARLGTLRYWTRLNEKHRREKQ